MKRFILAAAALTLVPAFVLAATPAAAPTGPTLSASDWRTPDPENVLVIDTNQGRIFVELAPLVAPKHVERIRALARAKFYDGLLFFRVVDGFMDQTGDPKNNGTGGSELPDLAPEFEFRRAGADPFTLVSTLSADLSTGATETGFVGVIPVRSAPQMQMMMSADGKVSGWGLFCAGTAGMARAQAPGSANSQFYLMREAYPSLDRNYTVWGRVVAGQDVVRKIKVGEPVAEPQDRMTQVRILADLPAKDRPKLQVVDTASPGFKALLESQKAAAGGKLSICDVTIPSKVN